MSLSIGELVGFIELEDRGFAKTLDAVDKNMSGLQKTTTRVSADIERTVDRAFAAIAHDIADGVDPNAALADLNRLVDIFDSAMDDIAGDARAGGQEAGNELTSGLRSGLADMEPTARTAAERAIQAIEHAASSLDNDLRDEGRKGGQALGDGLESGLGDAHNIGRHAGQDVADGLGDGGHSKLGGIGGDWLGMLKGLGWLEAGKTAGELLMGGIETAMERQDLFAKLATQVGAFGPEAERLGKLAGEIYNSAFGKEIGDVTEALGAVRSTLGNLDDGSLKTLTEDALTLAQTFGIDVNDAAASVGIQLKTGLAKNATEAFDIITTALQKVPAATRGDLLEVADEYSVFFKDLGINSKEGFGVLVKAASGGKIQLDKAGDALKEFKIRSTTLADSAAGYKILGMNAHDMAAKILAGGDSAKTAFQKILDGILKIKDPVKQSATAAAFFGEQFNDLGNIDALAALRPMTNALGNVEGAAKKASDQLGATASSSASAWSRSWEGLFADVGEKAMKAIQDFLPAPSDFSKQWDDVTGWFSGTVGPFFSKLWTGVKNKAVEIWNGLVDWIKGIPGKIAGGLSSGWDSIRSTASEKWTSIKNAAVQKATELIDWVKGLPGKIKSGLGNLGSLLLQAGHDLINGLINGIKAEAGRAVEAAKGVVSSAVDAAKHLLGIASPSKVFHTIGQHVVEGLALGIRNYGGLAIAEAEALARAVAAAAQKAAAAAAKAAQPQIGTAVSTTSNLPHSTSQSSGPGKKAAVAGLIEGSSGGVVINMHGTTVREPADIGRIGAEVGFKLASRG